MKKYTYRLGISVLVYFFFKLTGGDELSEALVWNFTSFGYLGYTIIAILISWEAISKGIIHWKKKDSIATNSGLYKLSLKATSLALPFVFFFSYIFVFLINTECCEHTLGPISRFWVMSAQAFVIALLMISYEIIIHYIRNAIQSAREAEIMKKELITAKFEGLKNQVNPHFLFNSFSVLTSLVEKDSKRAVEFISKLSDMYRYILENDERMLVDVSEEVAFLNDYIFLLKMRHDEGLKIDLAINASPEIKIPPMSLQILVENAVKHNAFSIDDPLTITIRNEEDRFIVVENRKRPKNDLVHSTGIGLKNLSKRLALAFKRGLEIVEDTQRFKVKLPISPEK